MDDNIILDKNLINLIKLNKISMNEYKNLMKLDLLNIKNYIDVINRLNTDTQTLLFNKYNYLLKYKDNNLIFKNKIIVNRILNSSTLEFTENQKLSINNIIRYITNPSEKLYGLFGYAGTGKTTIITELIYILLKLNYINSVVFTAPTNKALNIIKNKFSFYINKLLNIDENNNNFENYFENNLEKLRKRNIIIEFTTIHKLMKYKTEFTVDGEIIFVKDKDNLLNNYDLIIIDECSMVPINLLFEMIIDIDKINKRIIFLGDPAQLPPVNERYSSIFMNEKNFILLSSIKKYIPNIKSDEYDIFKKYIINMDRYTLTEIIRTKNTSIIEGCNLIREWIGEKDDFMNINKYIDDNLKIFPFNKPIKFLTEWYKIFEKIVENDSDSIIITWTNEETNKYNEYCRKIIFKKSVIEKFMIGDILILNEFYNINYNKFNTSEKIIVQKIDLIDYRIENLNEKINKTIKILNHHKSIETKYKKFIESINMININMILKCYKLKIIKIDDEKEYDIIVITDEDKEKHKNLTLNILEEIKKFRITLLEVSQLISLDNLLFQPLWREFYSKYINPFASVSYGYAITCHKAQGSNYKNVFVDFSDISKNNNDDEMKRCMYTAMSRTINKLYILI